jgi:hypothetical protein
VWSELKAAAISVLALPWDIDRSIDIAGHKRAIQRLNVFPAPLLCQSESFASPHEHLIECTQNDQCTAIDFSFLQ